MTLDRTSYDKLAASDSGSELAVVEDCLRASFDSRAVAPEVLSSAKTLKHVADIARLNKVTNFVLKPLPQGDQAEIAKLVGLLGAFRAKTAALNATTLADTLAVNDALAKANLDFVFLKGPAQQNLLYGEYFRKPAGDVDVLVSPDNFFRARDALGSIGYDISAQSRSRWWATFLGEQHLTRAGPRPSTIDLHQRLQQPGSPSPTDTEGFIRRRQGIDAAGTKIPFLSTPDIVLVASISVVKALFNREACAGYLCDVRAGIDALTATESQNLQSHASSLGLAETLLLGVRASDIVLGAGDGSLSIAAKSICPGINDLELRLMLIAPWTIGIKWPQRREMLWQLCGRKSLRYLSEATWAVSAEIGRRVFERPVAQ